MENTWRNGGRMIEEKKIKVGDIVVTKSRYRTKPEIHNIDLVGEIVHIDYVEKPTEYAIKIDKIKTKITYPMNRVYRVKSDIKHIDNFPELLKKAKEMKKLLDKFGD